MTPQEEQLLDSLVERVNQTQLTEKDPEAEAYLARTLGQNPDALYILTQTVLVQNMALEQAKAQVTALQQQLQQAQQAKPAHATSFLGSLLGKRDPEPAQPPVPPQYQTGYQPVSPQYTQTPGYPQAGYVQPGPVYGQPQYVPAEQPSFLRGAMQTAAGVAAGALAFEGVESLLHGGFGHGGGYGWGGPGMGMGGFGAPVGFERPVEETVINNNYYDDDRGGGGGEHHGGEERFHDTSDSGSRAFDGGNAHLSNADYRTSEHESGGDRADYAHGGGNNELDGLSDDQGSYDDDQQNLGDLGMLDDSSGDFDDGGGYDDGQGGDVL